MAGNSNDKELLNNTLLFIIKLLNQNNIPNWFIGYGTLLVIIRENSCIDGDDDVDIVMDHNNYDIVKQLLIDNGITLEYGYGIRNSKYIIKTKPTDKYCSVDFYMAILDKGNFNDIWEKVLWTNCYNDNNVLIKYNWNNETLYLPNNYETKLINRYGENWKIPQNTKGPTPRKLAI